MENANNYASFIKRIVTTTPEIRKRLLESSNAKIIKAICEIFLNIYHKQIRLSKEALKKLKKHKKFIVKILSKSTNTLQRKQLLVKNSDSLINLREIFK